MLGFGNVNKSEDEFEFNVSDRSMYGTYEEDDLYYPGMISYDEEESAEIEYDQRAESQMEWMDNYLDALDEMGKAYEDER